MSNCRGLFRVQVTNLRIKCNCFVVETPKVNFKILNGRTLARMISSLEHIDAHPTNTDFCLDENEVKCLGFWLDFQVHLYIRQQK